MKSPTKVKSNVDGEVGEIHKKGGRQQSLSLDTPHVNLGHALAFC